MGGSIVVMENKAKRNTAQGRVISKTTTRVFTVVLRSGRPGRPTVAAGADPSGLGEKQRQRRGFQVVGLLVEAHRQDRDRSSRQETLSDCHTYLSSVAGDASAGRGAERKILTSIAASWAPESGAAEATLASPVRCSADSDDARGAGRVGLGGC